MDEEKKHYRNHFSGTKDWYLNTHGEVNDILTFNLSRPTNTISYINIY